MTKNNDRISTYQIAMINIMTIVGIGIFSLPSSLAETAGADAWVMVLAGGILNTIASLIIVKLNTRFAHKTFADYCQEIIGAVPGKILLLIFTAYFILAIAYELRAFAEVTKMSLLFRTPTEVIMISLILLCAYVTRGGVECIGRMSEITFPILFISLLLVLLPGLPSLDYSNLLPIFIDVPRKLIKSLPLMVTSFAGFEFLLYYIGFMKEPKKAYKPVIYSMIFVTVFYIFIVVICLAQYGEKFLPKTIWPLIGYVRNINLPGLFIERLEGILMAIWTITVFTTIISAYFLSSYSISKILNTKEQKQYVLPLGMVAYYLALQPESIAQLFKWGESIFLYCSVFFIYIIPIMLLLIAAIRKLGVKQNEKK